MIRWLLGTARIREFEVLADVIPLFNIYDFMPASEMFCGHLMMHCTMSVVYHHNTYSMIVRVIERDQRYGAIDKLSTPL